MQLLIQRIALRFIFITLLLDVSVFANGQKKAAEPSPAAMPLQTKIKQQQLIARLEQRLPQLMKEGDVPGLSVALLRKGKLVWHRGFGVTNARTQAPVTNETVFEAASLSKPVFAYAVMKLVDSGKFDLDKPLNQYLPGNYDVADDARLNQITARHVLTHTSGFPNWRNGALKIYVTPGERFSYSGEGFVYLSKVIEHVTGEPFNDFMKRMVFVPLGMTHSSYSWRADYDQMKAFAHNELGGVVGQNKPPEKKLNGFNAAASLHTTAEDFGRFVAAVMNGTGLKPATHKMMLAPQVQVREGGPNSIFRPKAQALPTIAWGLGWGVQNTADGLSFWHWGDNGACKAYVVAFAQQKLGVVIFANSANGLSIVPEIINEAVGGEQPALSWLNYESYKSPGRTLLKNILAKGATSALAEYQQWRSTHPVNEAIKQERMNQIGYALLSAKHEQDALAVFQQNVTDYPQSSNAYDSLGEAYAVTGNIDLAIKNYERSVELSPINSNGIEALKKLRQKKGN